MVKKCITLQSLLGFLTLVLTGTSSAIAQEAPTGLVPMQEAFTITEGVHRFGSPYSKRQMRYSSTGRLAADIVLDDGWGTTPVTVKAGTPVFGAVFASQYRQTGVARTIVEPMWCGVLDTPHKQLGNGQSFCGGQGNGSQRARTVADRAFNPPDWIRFVRPTLGGTLYNPNNSLMQLGIGPKIKGRFDVKSEPVEFGKQLWMGTAVMSWGRGFFLTAQLHGEGENYNLGAHAISQVLPTGTYLQRLGSDIVELEKVDDQHYRATIIVNRASEPSSAAQPPEPPLPPAP